MKTSVCNRGVTDRYFDLVRRFPLRTIRDDDAHAAATKLIRELMLQGEETLDSGELDYLEALARFVEDYEKTRYRIGRSKPSSLQMLKHLMEARDMKPADLGRLIGSSAASMVLHGRRELSKSHILRLADHFGVDPGLLF